MGIPLWLRTIDKFIRLHERIRNLIIKRKLEIRKDNYPYLGSDTYFNLCDESITSQEEISKILNLDYSKISGLFILGDLVTDIANKIRMTKVNCDTKLKFIVISESDKVQNVEELQILLRISEKIFSNNVYGNHNNVVQIPLGLEKQSFLSSSRMKEYKSKSKLKSYKRTINFLVAWNDKTNLNRIVHRKNFLEVPNSLILNYRVSPRVLHYLMRKTKFIPSPAGNGPDCHRTWEAIYFGCVPVILKSEFLGPLDWPILLVENWDDLTSKSDSELNKIYEDFSLTYDESIVFSKNIISKIK